TDCLTHQETIDLALPLLWDDARLSVKEPAWLRELEELRIVLLATPIPLIEPMHLNDLLERVWTSVRQVGGPRPIAPMQVDTVRETQRELDRVVRWCEKQGRPDAATTRPQRESAQGTKP